MQVKEIMTQNVELLDHDATLNEAARIMRVRNIGSIPVSKDDRLVGMITDRDIVVRALALGLDPSKEKVSRMMSSPIAYCFEDQSMEDAAQIMEERGIRRLPILSRQKRLVGLVSLSDVACGGHDERLTARTLEAVCASGAY